MKDTFRTMNHTGGGQSGRAANARRARKRLAFLSGMLATASWTMLARADPTIARSPPPVVGLFVQATDDEAAARLARIVGESLAHGAMIRVLTRDALSTTPLAGWQPESASQDASLFVDFVLVVTSAADGQGGLAFSLRARPVAPAGLPIHLHFTSASVAEESWKPRLSREVGDLADVIETEAMRSRENGIPPIAMLQVDVRGPHAGLSVESNGKLIVTQASSRLAIGLREGTYGLHALCRTGTRASAVVAVNGETGVTLHCPEMLSIPPMRSPLPILDRTGLGPSASRPIEQQIYSISLGVGGARIDKSAVSWCLGFDGPVLHAGAGYWNTGRFRFVMNAESANAVVLAPLVGSLGGLTLRTRSGEVQVGVGPAGGLLLLESRPERLGFKQGVIGGMAELGYQTSLELSARDRAGLWFGIEGLGMFAPGRDRSMFEAMFVGRFGFMKTGDRR
jgi:hypothetical protein